MTAVGMENLDLVKYLVSQVMMTDEDRFNELKKYYPDAKPEDWRMNQGGQRVQIIKKEPGKPASLQFGTEIFAFTRWCCDCPIRCFTRCFNFSLYYVELA